jgi:hypothetical protein
MLFVVEGQLRIMRALSATSGSSGGGFISSLFISSLFVHCAFQALLSATGPLSD